MTSRPARCIIRVLDKQTHFYAIRPCVIMTKFYWHTFCSQVHPKITLTFFICIFFFCPLFYCIQENGAVRSIFVVQIMAFMHFVHTCTYVWLTVAMCCICSSFLSISFIWFFFIFAWLLVFLVNYLLLGCLSVRFILRDLYFFFRVGVLHIQTKNSLTV